LAGARVGICFGHPTIIGFLQKIKPPYNISSLAQVAVELALDKSDRLDADIRAIIAQKERLYTYLTKHPLVINVFPSDANFLLFQCSDPNGMYQDMVATGIVIRNRSSQLHCAGCLRVSIGTETEVDKVIEWFERHKK